MATGNGDEDDGDIDLVKKAEWMAIARHEASRPLTPEEEKKALFRCHYGTSAYELMDLDGLRQALNMKDELISRQTDKLQELSDKLEDVMESPEEDLDTLSSAIAFKVAQALQANAPFTAEDIERIKDHVHPQGVAYQNGFRAGFERAVEALEDAGQSEFTVSAAHLRRLLLVRSPMAAPKQAE